MIFNAIFEAILETRFEARFSNIFLRIFSTLSHEYLFKSVFFDADRLFFPRFVEKLV